MKVVAVRVEKGAGGGWCAQENLRKLKYFQMLQWSMHGIMKVSKISNMLQTTNTMNYKFYVRVLHHLGFING